MKYLRLLPLLLAVALVGLAADDPWDGETASWDQKDVQKILNGSPWAKRVATKMTLVDDDAKADAPQSSVNKNDRGDMRAGDFINVVWWSARTPRRAFLRMAQLSGGKVDEAQAQQFSESERDEYQVVLWGEGPMIPTSGKLPKEELMKAAWLESPRLKKKIQPSDVEVVADDRGRAQRIVFSFPKQVDGQPLIGADEKRLNFKWRLPKAAKETVDKAQQFEAAFEPRKMMARGAQDL